MTSKERNEVEAQLENIPDQEERLLLATGRYIGSQIRLDTDTKSK